MGQMIFKWMMAMRCVVAVVNNVTRDHCIIAKEIIDPCLDRIKKFANNYTSELQPPSLTRRPQEGQHEGL